MSKNYKYSQKSLLHGPQPDRHNYHQVNEIDEIEL